MLGHPGATGWLARLTSKPVGTIRVIYRGERVGPDG